MIVRCLSNVYLSSADRNKDRPWKFESYFRIVEKRRFVISTHYQPLSLQYCLLTEVRFNLSFECHFICHWFFIILPFNAIMRSLTQALHDKYSDDEDVKSSDFVMFVHVPRTSQRQRLPSVLVLDHCDIDSVGDEESLSSNCSDVRELDLSNNQISGWNEVIPLSVY